MSSGIEIGNQCEHGGVNNGLVRYLISVGNDGEMTGKIRN